MITSTVLQSVRRRLRQGSANPLLAFGLCTTFGNVPAQAGDANALPQDPTVAAGGASFAQSGKTLTVNQTTSRVVIDWRSFDIGADALASFNQPSASSIAVNRINAGTDPTKIDGRLQANGQVWILNPNGVLFGKTAQVNAAGVVASTATIDTSRFMAGDNQLAFTGRDSGTVVNEGHISVGDSGLAAFVAPSVRNSGVITARTGKVTLAAGTTFTLDLAGDHLVEIGIGSDKAVVDQSGKIVDPGGTVQLSARAASAVVDGVINMSGAIRTASARRAGGDIILDGDSVSVSGTADASGASGGTIAISAKTIDISDSATLRADASGNGNGGTITATASLGGTYAGRYSARGGAAGGDGGRIETSGAAVTTSPNIAVDASAANGSAGEWLIDPLNVTISTGSGGGLAGATVTTGAIQTALAGGTSVSITTAQSGSGAGDLTLAGSINATATGNAGLTLTGRHLSATGNSVVNLAGGALTLNVNAVNANSTPPTGGWINDALAMIGTVSGGATINLGAGTYTTGSGYINVNKSNVTINGAGQGLTILDSRNASTYGLRVTALNNVTLNGFTLYGATGTNAYGLKAEATTNLTLTNITSQGAAKSEFDLNGIIGGTLNNLTANGAAATGAGFTSGAPTAGNGISLTDSQNITLTNSTTLNNQWGGLALYQSNFPSGYTFQEKNITVAASNSFTETNPIYAEDQSATNNFGALILAGYNYVIQTTGTPSDVYSWFQKTQQAAIDYAVGTGTGATVQGYVGNGQTGNNIFTVGIGSNGSAMSIATALAAALAGATVNVMNGTYVITSSTPYLDISKSLTLTGQSQAGTIIDAHAASQYGLRVTADNVSLSNFTLLGVTAAGNSYGIKVENNTDPSPDARINNFSISNVTSHGARKAQLDLNGVVGATIDHFTADGTSNGFGSGSQAGAGIAITDSANVTISNSSTNNNAYGGLALYETNVSRNQQVTGITVAANNTFSETVPVYMEDTSASLNFGAVNIAGFNYMVADPSNPSDLFTFFQKTQQGAVNYAASRGTASYVQGWTGTAANNVFTVGTSTGGTAMSIQSAVNAASTGATINVLNGTYVVPATLGITTSLSLMGQSQAGTILDASAASTYSIRVQADNVTLGNFTLLGSHVTGGYGIKVEPLNLTNVNARINNFSISNVTINGSNKNGLDINGAHVALIDHVTAENTVAGNGIAIIDSTNVTVTGSVTANNAWGGLRIEEKNASFNQQTDQVTVDASNSFSEAVPVYMEDDSASQNFGTVTVQGFGYIVRAPASPADIYTWFQKTQQNAIDYAASLNLATATVQGWTGTAGNNHFAVGIGSLTGGASRSLSIQTALNAALPDAIIDIASGSYAESLVQNTRATMNFGTVTLGGSYTLNSGAANSTLSGTVSATAVTWNAPVLLGGGLLLNTSAANGAITTAAIDGNKALTLNAGTGTVSLGALGATTALGAVTDPGATTLTGSAYNAASFNFGSVILATDASLNATGTVSATSVDGNHALTINAGSASLGALGGTTALGAVTDLGATTLTGSTYNAASFNLGSVIIAANTSLNATGTVSAASVDGNHALTINAGSANLGALGATTALGVVTDLGAATLTGSTYNAASFSFGSVILAANTSLNAIGTVSATSIDGNHALTINAGSASLGALGGITALGAVTDFSSTILNGNIYNATSFNLGSVILAADTGLNATGAVSAVSIDGNHALTINAGSSSLGTLGGTTTLGVVTDLGATTLTGGTYNAASFNLGNVVLTVDTSLNAQRGITALAIDGNHALTIGAGTVTLGALGSTTALGAVTDLSATTLTGGTYNAASFNFGSITLAADTGLNATGAVSAASIDGNHALTISAGSASLGTLGSTATLGAVTDLSSTTLTGSIYNAASFNFGSVTLAADTSLNATGAVSATSIDGNHALTVSAGAASLGAMGGTTALGTVTDLGATTLNGGTYNAASFNFGSLILAADTGLNATGTISATSIDGNHALTITAGSVSLGATGGTTPLGTVTDLGATTLTGGTYNATSFNLGSVILAADTNLNATGAVTVTAIDGNHALTINAGSANIGTLGGTTALGAVTDPGATTLNGGTYNATSFNLGSVTLAADTSFNATGTVSAASIDGNHALTINAGSSSLGALGGTSVLGAVTDLGAATLTGGTYNAASLNFAGDLTLTASQTILDTSIRGGDITVGGTLLGTADGAQSITLRAGPGTGTAAQNGNILLQNVGATSLALGSMTVMGDNFGAQTVHLAGDFHSNLTGNQVFSSHTLNARGVVQSAVGGNASGPINAGGTIGLSVTGQLSGAIGGSTITLNAGTVQGVAVTATQAVTVTANSVAGSTLTAPTVTATANTFNTNVNAGSVSLDAGSITGSTITGSQAITIKATSVAGSSLAAPTVNAAATDSFSTNINASSVTLNAGSVSGSSITGSSNVTVNATSVATSNFAAPTVNATATGSFSTNISASSVTLSAGSVSGSSITGSSDVTVSAKSVQSSNLAAPVVTATADSFNTAVTASSSAKISGSDVAGAFSGGSFTISGSNSVNASIDANSATVSSSTISGTFTGNAISLSGSTSVNATVTSNTLAVQSPSGNLQGNWSNVDTGSSGTLVLNHQASIGDGNVGPSQLVVENFSLPQGTSVTRRGDLVLPQNLVLGLASPAGQTAPSFIVVQSVQELGTLLSQSYSPIVIELAGPVHKALDTN